MKTIKDIEKFLRLNKINLIEKYGIKEIGVFGSYIRGEQKETSDIDILVEFKKPVGLFEFIAFKNYLSDFLGVNVDLAMKKALKPKLSEKILKEVLYV